MTAQYSLTPEFLQHLDVQRRTQRIVLCHGVFDLLHIGHIRYLHRAKEYGDLLVVSVTPDHFVDKGPGRPAFTEQLRAEALAALDGVDYVLINQWPTAEELLRLIKPHVYAKGSEFKGISDDPTGKIALEAKVAEEMGIELVFIEDIVFSSSNLINRFFSTLEKETQDYLALFKDEHSLDDVRGYLDELNSVSALVMGDVILDVYTYCQPLGKSSKDPVLAIQYQSQDTFGGGSLAVANHVSQFSSRTGIFSVIGDDGAQEIVESALHPNIRRHLFVRPKSSTVRKERFLDGYSLQKIVEVYTMDTSPLPEALRQRMQTDLEPQLAEYDLVIASDFGHGAIWPQGLEILCRKAPFLAVNAQANAGNRGFHTISRYPRADFISLAEHEIRLEFRDVNGSIPQMMEQVVRRTGCKIMAVTQGRRGCALMDNAGNFTQVPSFAANVVDRIGAGDAFFAVTSLAASLNFSLPVIGFLGNVVGAIAVECVGNQKPVNAQTVRKYITALLK